MSLSVYLHEPKCPHCGRKDELFWKDMTGNLYPMAQEANLNAVLWEPNELGIKTAKDLIEPLIAGLEILLYDPKRFERLNPPNGWGTYNGLVSFVRDYLNAAIKHPDSIITTD